MKSQSSLEVQIYELEKRLLQPKVRKSPKDLADLLADDFIEYGSSGYIYDKQQVVEELPNSPTVRMTISDFEIKLLAQGVELTRFRVEKHKSEGEIQHTLRSSVWKMIEDRWQMVFHQGTLLEHLNQ